MLLFLLFYFYSLNFFGKKRRVDETILCGLRSFARTATETAKDTDTHTYRNTYTDRATATRTQNATLNAAGIDSGANYYCFSVVEAQWKGCVEKVQRGGGGWHAEKAH